MSETTLTDTTSTETAERGTTERAVLAGGCFWGMQDLIRKRPGVISTRVGYTGGDVANATYRNHGSHAEAIEIIFDPEQESFRDLLEFFFQIHDPTTKNRQGNDLGASYRSAIFYTDEEQRSDRRGHDRRRRRVGTVARQGGHRGRPGRPVLGSRARAPGLPRAVPGRLHLPLRAAELEAPAPRRERLGPDERPWTIRSAGGTRSAPRSPRRGAPAGSSGRSLRG